MKTVTLEGVNEGRKHCINLGIDDKKLNWEVVLEIEKIEAHSRKSHLLSQPPCPLPCVAVNLPPVQYLHPTKDTLILICFTLLSAPWASRPFGQASFWDCCLISSLPSWPPLFLLGTWPPLRLTSMPQNYHLFWKIIVLNFLTCLPMKQSWPLNFLCVFGRLTILCSTFRIPLLP